MPTTLDIHSDRERYRAHLAELKRQIVAVEAILQAFDGIEGGPVGDSGSGQRTPPTGTGIVLPPLPEKITPAVLSVLHQGRAMSVSEIKKALLARGFDSRTSDLYEKIYRVLMRQVVQRKVLQIGEKGAYGYALA